MRDGLSMTERHVIAYAILLVCLIAAVAISYLMFRARRVAPHLRIDLLGKQTDEPPPTKP
jgi:hypothetical protein